MISSKPPLAVYRRAEFCTSQFRLRPARLQDQHLMFGWRSDAETSRFLMGAAPKSIEDQLKWFEKISQDTSFCYHILEYQGEPVGFTSMFNADPAHSDAEWGVVMGKHRGEGLVRIFAPLCCVCALKFGELENIYTCINEKNSVALRKMEQLGATLFEEPSVYRKKGELLFRLNSDDFKKILLTLTETNPAWTDDLDVEMHVVESVA